MNSLIATLLISGNLKYTLSIKTINNFLKNINTHLEKDDVYFRVLHASH